MAVASLHEVGIMLGGRRVLNAASLSINDGERLGLIGVNGSGKTTILRMLAGTLSPDTGRSDRRRQLRIGFLEQEPELPAQANVHEAALGAFSDLLEMEARMRAIEHAIASSDGERRSDLLRQLGRMQEQFEHAGGYEKEVRVASVLMGLGFTKEEFNRPVDVLSGGERTRLALARLLLREADLLLLDEPTNHLDLAGIEWLEQFILRFSGAVVVVSHDRQFLDRVAGKIIELSSGTLEEYPGNYSKYVAIRDARRLEQERRFEKQQEHIAKEEEFIRRYHAAQRGREARGRQKRLARLDREEAPASEKGIALRFNQRRQSGEICLRVEELQKKFGNHTLFNKLSFEVYRGERIGIVGPNGSGKTTLLNVLMGNEPPDTGHVQTGAHVHFGHLKQISDDLFPERTVLDEVWEHKRTLTELEVRSVLGRFLFSGDDAVNKRMSALSGGERTRVALACLMIDQPNVLALDEPTNHLDIPSREALETALEEYEGTIIAVSHDRYFINRLMRKLVLLDGNGGTRLVHGNYEMYERLRAQEHSEAAATAPQKSPRQRVADKQRPKLSKNRLAKIESEIGQLEREKESLEAEMADPALYINAERSREVPHRYSVVCAKLEALYAEWTQDAE